MDKTVQSREILLELIYGQATQASDPWLEYQGKEEHKQLDKHLHKTPSSLLPSLNFPYFCCSYNQSIKTPLAMRRTA